MQTADLDLPNSGEFSKHNCRQLTNNSKVETKPETMAQFQNILPEAFLFTKQTNMTETTAQTVIIDQKKYSLAK